MTRINLEDPSLLCEKHLRGEWYELPRIVTSVLKLEFPFHPDDIPAKFTVRTSDNPTGGKGHMKFFYNKLGWLRTRYVSLINELHERNLEASDNWNPRIYQPQFAHLFGDWKPSEEDVSLSRKRIAEMIPVGAWFCDSQLERMSEIKEYQKFLESLK